MCGIIGQLSYQNPIDRNRFLAMRDQLRHRGPDGKGAWFAANEQVALGHRRLSFLDLTEAGSQPMRNETGTVWLTINGEIYNHRQLRQQLEDRGHEFCSGSDSEVVVHGYEEWGTDVLQHLKGMFAFGIWDEEKQRLFLARDRFGIKPLYFYRDQQNFAFASEVKALRCNQDFSFTLDHTSVSDFLAYRYVPSPKTIWQEVAKLPPAHYLLMEWQGAPEVHCYWRPPFGSRKADRNKLVETLDEQLHESVRQHIISDVQIGSFLSGGYDSSALVYELSRLNYPTNTFAIGFEGWDKSEHFYAEKVAGQFGMNHHATVLEGGSRSLLDKLAYVYDEPIADISIIPTYSVSKLAAGHVKSVLSGEGADELFCGYDWQHAYMEKMAGRSWQERMAQKLGWQEPVDTVEFYAEAMAMGRFNNHTLREALHEDFLASLPADSEWFYRQHYQPQLSPLKSIQNMDIRCFMGELVLTKIDRASMANSLEVRVPYLDHELFETLLQVKESCYFQAGQQKILLKELIKDVMPWEILQRQKQGFVGPDSYYREISWYRDELMDGRLLQENVIKEEAVQQYLSNEDHWRLWKLLILEKWYREWM